MSKKTVLKFTDTAETHYEDANAALDRGEYILALTHVNAARWLDPVNADYRILSGDAYFEAGLYSRALEQEMTLLAMTMFMEKPSFDMVFGCVRCLLAMGERSAALQYFNLAVAVCEDFSPDMLEAYGEEIPMLMALANSGSNFVLTDTNEDDKRAIEVAVKLIRDDEYGSAFDFLTGIDVSSKFYWSAQAWLMDCLNGCNDIKTIRARAEEMVKIDSWAAVVTAAHAYSYLDEPETFLGLCAKIKRYRGDDVFILGRAVQNLTQAEDYFAAYEFVQKALKHFPFDCDLLLMQAVILSKLGRMGEASNVLLTILAIDPYNTIAMYHNGQLQDGKPLPIDPFQLPEEEIERRINMVAEICLEENAEKVFDHSYNLAILKWLIMNNFMPDDAKFDFLFALAEIPRCEFLFREIVVELNTPRTVRELLTAVMVYAWSSDLCVSVGCFVTRIDCRLPAHAKKKDEYLRAWAYLLAAMSQCAINYEKLARSLFAKLIQCKNLPKLLPKQLAAAILALILMEHRDEIDILCVDGIFQGLVENAEELQGIIQKIMPSMIESGMISKPDEEDE